MTKRKQFNAEFKREEVRLLLETSQKQPSDLAREVGYCYDNAVAESFFSSLKNEIVHHSQLSDARRGTNRNL